MAAGVAPASLQAVGQALSSQSFDLCYPVNAVPLKRCLRVRVEDLEKLIQLFFCHVLLRIKRDGRSPPRLNNDIPQGGLPPSSGRRGFIGSHHKTLFAYAQDLRRAAGWRAGRRAAGMTAKAVGGGDLFSALLFFLPSPTGVFLFGRV